MTDIEKIHLDRARKLNPNIDLLITRFSLDTSSITPAEKTSSQVANRVDQWFSEFKAAKPTPIEIIQEPTIFSSPEEIKAWITQTNFTL